MRKHIGISPLLSLRGALRKYHYPYLYSWQMSNNLILINSIYRSFSLGVESIVALVNRKVNDVLYLIFKDHFLTHK